MSTSLIGVELSHAPQAPSIRYVDRVTYGDLLDVFSRREFAVVVPEFCSTKECQLLRDGLLSFPGWTTYEPDTGADSIGTIGESLFGCLGQELCSEYFEKAAPLARALRKHLRPLEFPLDRVIREVENDWPFNAGPLRIGGRPCFAGLCRMFRVGGEAYPHDDRADIDYPSLETAAILDQALVNIYVSKTDSGGHLQFWDRVFDSRDEYERLRLGNTYGLDRSLIGPPDAVLDPPLGALVIGSARRLHAVTECCGGGVRLSISTFLDFVGEGAPIYFHS